MTSDAQPEPGVEIPEFRREPGGVPWLGISVVVILALIGLGLVAFALSVGQREAEARAIGGTVAVVLSFTATPSDTRPPPDTPLPSATPPPPTESAPPPSTEPPTAEPTSTGTATATNTRAPTRPFVFPTDTPVPPPTPTSAPATSRGITGQLTLCNPEKPSYAAKIERICFRELIVNNTAAPVSYGFIGVQAANLSGGPGKFHTSWSGNLSIGPGCSGPTDTCGGAWEDGLYLENPGTYRLTLAICYSSKEVCLSASGDWETLTPGIIITVVDWTPSP